MGEWFKQLPAKIVEFWNKYTAKQKTLFLSIVAAVVIVTAEQTAVIAAEY